MNSIYSDQKVLCTDIEKMCNECSGDTFLGLILDQKNYTLLEWGITNGMNINEYAIALFSLKCDSDTFTRIITPELFKLNNLSGSELSECLSSVMSRRFGSKPQINMKNIKYLQEALCTDMDKYHHNFLFALDDSDNIELAEWVFSLNGTKSYFVKNSSYKFTFSSLDMYNMFKKNGYSVTTDTISWQSIQYALKDKNKEFLIILIDEYCKLYPNVPKNYDLYIHISLEVSNDMYYYWCELLLSKYPNYNKKLGSHIFVSAIKSNNIKAIRWCKDKNFNIHKNMINSDGLSRETLELLSEWGLFKFSTGLAD